MEEITAKPESRGQFALKDFTDAVEKSSIRSRKILIILVLSSLIILVALINSVDIKLNWFLSRYNLYKKADTYIHFEGDTSAKTVPTLCDFVKLNEAHFGNYNTADLEEDLRKELPHFQDTLFPINIILIDHALGSTKSKRFSVYKEVSKSINYVYSSGIKSREDIEEKMNSFNQAQLEHINFIRVPILGISFDINYLGIYAGLAILFLYWLSYSSLKREHINTKIAFKQELYNNNNHHYDFYEYMSMMQVLNMPKKLFRPVSRRHLWSQNLTGFIALISPLAVFAAVVVNDTISYPAGKAVNANLTLLSYLFELCLSGLILLEFYIVYRLWRKMDHLWDTQTIEYNFEFILECTGEDDHIDLKKHAEEIVIEKKHLPQIQTLWYITLKKIQNGSSQTPQKSLSFFKEYINNVLGGRFIQDSSGKHNQKNIEDCWNRLKNWFNTYGRKNITNSYAKTFHEMCIHVKLPANINID